MRVSIAAALCLPLALTGCTMTNTGTPSPVQGAALLGSVHGGQQAISGAHVYLFAANSGVFTPNTNGYGNASVSLLNAGSTGHSDSLGAYVLTDSQGNFSISNDYSCTPNTQVYVYALGGNPGGGANPYSALMAALGNCPAAGNFLATVSFINMNEVTTVATAYAIAGFASDATHVSSSGTALAQTGIKNAFANAANLANLAAGTAVSTTPGGNGTAPQSEINTLGNILAACINTNDSVTISAGCSTLFANATADGTPSGTQPTDTASAAINIAHHPGANVATLYGLITAQPPFGPALASAPNDWTVGIEFAEGGDSRSGGTADPFAIAVDASGNVWSANNGQAVGAAAELGPDGSINSGANGFSDGTSAQFDGIAVDLNGNLWIPSVQSNCLVELRGTDGLLLSPPGGFTGGGLSSPQAVAVDPSGNVWVTNPGNNSISKFNGTTGAAISGSGGYTGGNLSKPWSITIDSTGNAWVANQNTSSVTKLKGTDGSVLSGSSGYTGGGISAPFSIALDASSNVWLANAGTLSNGSIAELSSTGAAALGSPFTGGGVDPISSSPQAVALDGAGNVWVGIQSQTTIAEFSNTGTPISPSTGYAPPGIVAQTIGVAVDGSGDVWLADPSASNSSHQSLLVELVGAATPVVTPLSAAAKNNTYGTRP